MKCSVGRLGGRYCLTEPTPNKRPDYVNRLNPVARKLRREMTFPERLLWSRLRRDGLGTEVRRQVPIGPYVVGFFVPAARLVVEVDGRSHEGRGEADAAREVALVALGLRVVRVSNDAAIRDVAAVVAYLRGALTP